MRAVYGNMKRKNGPRRESFETHLATENYKLDVFKATEATSADGPNLNSMTMSSQVAEEPKESTLSFAD